MDISIINKTKFPVKRLRVKQTAIKACKFFKHIADLSVVFVTKREIKKINKTYRKKDEYTDVLSFPYKEGKEVTGEVFICYEVARNDAEELGVKVYDMIDVLLVHGIVHIAGYDHKTNKEQKKMEEMERKIHSSLR